MSDNSEISPAKYARQAKWRDQNPMATWAQAALRSAVKRGLVVQQNCFICSDPNSEAHHPDYARPAHVEWYCRRHHKAVHRNSKAGGSNG